MLSIKLGGCLRSFGGLGTGQQQEQLRSFGRGRGAGSNFSYGGRGDASGTFDHAGRASNASGGDRSAGSIFDGGRGSRSSAGAYGRGSGRGPRGGRGVVIVLQLLHNSWLRRSVGGRWCLHCFVIVVGVLFAARRQCRCTSMTVSQERHRMRPSPAHISKVGHTLGRQDCAVSLWPSGGSGADRVLRMTWHRAERVSARASRGQPVRPGDGRGCGAPAYRRLQLRVGGPALPAATACLRRCRPARR